MSDDKINPFYFFKVLFLLRLVPKFKMTQHSFGESHKSLQDLSKHTVPNQTALLILYILDTLCTYKSMSMLFLRKWVTNHMICPLYSSPDFKYIATDEAQPYLLFLLWI